MVCLWFRGKEWEKNLVPQFNLILRVFSKFKCEKKPDDHDGSTWLIVRRWDIGIFGARLLVSRCISFCVQPLLVVTVDTPQKVRWLESMFRALFKVFRFKWNIERGILKQVVKDFCTMDYTKGVFNVSFRVCPLEYIYIFFHQKLLSYSSFLISAPIVFYDRTDNNVGHMKKLILHDESTWILPWAT